MISLAGITFVSRLALWFVRGKLRQTGQRTERRIGKAGRTGRTGRPDSSPACLNGMLYHTTPVDCIKERHFPCTCYDSDAMILQNVSKAAFRTRRSAMACEILSARKSFKMIMVASITGKRPR